MKPPLLLINFKLYRNSYGEGAIEFSRILERISLERSVEIIISVPATMISRLADGISIPVFAQHVD
ncbi:MAG: triose-phosphate isomerase, partial [Thaumarchaeota archaeon]|nr:triose-phosphate isomerase [Nitrososphaerota archaeon]